MTFKVRIRNNETFEGITWRRAGGCGGDAFAIVKYQPLLPNEGGRRSVVESIVELRPLVWESKDEV